MKRILLFFVLFSLFNCQLSETDIKYNKKTENNYFKSKSYNISDSTSGNIDIKTTDTLLNLSFKNDSVYFNKGKQIVFKTYLNPNRILNNDSINPKEIKDEAFIIANNLIILRDIKSAGHFCLIPEVEKIEIYSKKEFKKSINKNESKSKSLLGFDFTCNFLGNRFTSPKENWGLISIEAEGNLLGFIIIDSNANVIEKVIDDSLNIQGLTYSAFFNDRNELIWDKLTNDFKPIKFIVNSMGEYKTVIN